MAESGGEILLSLENIAVSFGELKAVRDISFSLRGGDLLGLIGPNGAGKTTLLRAACGLQELSNGQVHVLGMAVHKVREALRHLGFTPDTPPMYEQLTVRQFLEFIGRGYELADSEINERIDFWLEKVWLKDAATKLIKDLSRGMRQRVGIARTLLPNPTVILLDEPAAGLDPGGRAQFRALLCSLREQGKAIIVSSHILADMEEYCSHIGIMSKGSMLQFGTVAQIAGQGQGQRCTYSVLLARPWENLAQTLGEMAGVSHVRANGARFSIEYESGSPAAATLLAELMKLGLPVAGFTAESASIESVYMRAGVAQVE